MGVHRISARMINFKSKRKCVLICVVFSCLFVISWKYSDVKTVFADSYSKTKKEEDYGDNDKNIQEIKKTRVWEIRTLNVESDRGSNKTRPKPITGEAVEIGILILAAVRDKNTPVTEFMTLLNDGLTYFTVSGESYFRYTVYIGIQKGSDVEKQLDSIKNFSNLTRIVTVVVESASGVKTLNSIAEKAYNDGMEYLVKVDAGTKISGNAWTSACVRTLLSFNKNHVGVAGATCSNCKTDIFTHYMVHRSHLDIFFDFYPPDFNEMWADDWISMVYGQHRRKSVAEWQVTVSKPPADNRDATDIETKGSIISIEVRDRARVDDFLSTTPLLSRVVSFSFYGSSPRYTVGAAENVALMPFIYPGWQMWVYYDNTVPSDLLKKMSKPRYVKLIPMSTKEMGNQMSWRFYVATNKTLDYFIIRDIDSRLSKRDKAAVDEWLASGKKFHIIRDHPSHSAFPISGGMWGGTREAIPQMVNLLKEQKAVSGAYLWDMNFLNKAIWPEAQKSLLQHDAFSCNKYGGGKPWPRPREGLEHVGSVYIDGKLRAGDLPLLANAVAPKECVYVPFKIIIIANSCHSCLERLLDSLQHTDYSKQSVHVEIGILDQNNSPNINTIRTAVSFKFKHGTESFRFFNKISDIHTAWLEAWKPISDTQHALILTDDSELSPFWFKWLSQAWDTYKTRKDIGAVSLSQQNLIASSGAELIFKHDKPFLYRMPSPYGFSPCPTQWKSYTEWAKKDRGATSSVLSANIAKEWLQKTKGFWIQSWLEWCWTNKQLYTLYVHPSDGYLVTQWNAQTFSPKLAKRSDSILEKFPQDLEQFGWDYTLGTENTNRKPTSHNKSIVVWSNDLHISPIANIKSILAPMNITFIDKSLSGHCHLTKTCATDLKVLNKGNGMNPSADVRKRFQEAYKNDPVMGNVDIVMCFHPSAMCELFMPFGKRLFVISSTRYEIGRWDAASWNKWNDNLRLINDNTANVVAANNVYDAEYIRYFTGILPILLPSVVVMPDRYNPTSEDILIPSMHSPSSGKILTMLKNVSGRFKDLHGKYAHYTYKQLCENTAILHIPYQLSVMSLFEQYAMGIPIIVPSPELLWELHDKYDIVTERTWERVNTGKRPVKSSIPGVNASIPDPNNDHNKDAFMFWIKLGDFYQWKHIVVFKSFEELSSILTKTDWKQVSKAMLLEHDKQVEEIRKSWECLLYTTNWRTCFKPISYH